MRTCTHHAWGVQERKERNQTAWTRQPDDPFYNSRASCTTEFTAELRSSCMTRRVEPIAPWLEKHCLV